MAEEKNDNLKARPASDRSETRPNLVGRPPIIVVLGHVDHGKTTLLDYIRKISYKAKAAPFEGEPRSVAEREEGGITQSTGAYEIIHNSKKITFIDTPGHEAFSKMRARGATAADLAILVIAADDGVKPQTKEAINILNETKTPFIVAINKIDKNNADIERIKQELTQVGVLLEGYGGNVSWQGVSAKTGEGIKELLDLILLASEMEGLTYDPSAPASGFIIESKMDSQRGITAMAIVNNGTLRVGDSIKTASASGKIKILENFLGERVNELLPSSPALIMGFETLPQMGEEFSVGETMVSGTPAERIPNLTQANQIESHLIHIILKADVSGSLEVLSEIIKTIPDVQVVARSIGEITDGDVKSALPSRAVIIGFNSRVSRAADNLAKANSIKIISSGIIYELIEKIKEELKQSKGEVATGELQVLAVFGKKSGRRQVVGGKVVRGVFKNNSSVKIQKGEQITGEARILNIQKQKVDVSEAKEGDECGLLVESDVVINAGDKLI